MVNYKVSRCISEKKLIDRFRISKIQAKAIRKAAEQNADKALEVANRVIKGYGVEAIWGYSVTQPVLIYVNKGDTYALTLCYDLQTKELFAGSWGDWVERKGEKLGVW